MKKIIDTTFRMREIYRPLLLLMVLFASLLATGGSFQAAADGGAEIRLRTALSGAAIGGVVPSGHADFRSRTGRTSLVVEVEHVNLANGTVLGVFVTPLGGVETKVGSITLNLGFGELDLDSQNGDFIPAGVGSGTIVTVKNGTAPILSGTL